MADTNAVATKPQDVKQEEKQQVIFSFLAPHLSVLFNIFSRDMGEDELKKLPAAKIQKQFNSWLRSILVKGITAKRNSVLNGEYLRYRAQVDNLVDGGESRESAEEDIFGMTGTQYRRKLAVNKKAPLF